MGGALELSRDFARGVSVAVAPPRLLDFQSDHDRRIDDFNRPALIGERRVLARRRVRELRRDGYVARSLVRQAKRKRSKWSRCVGLPKFLGRHWYPLRTQAPRRIHGGWDEPKMDH